MPPSLPVKVVLALYSENLIQVESSPKLKNHQLCCVLPINIFSLAIVFSSTLSECATRKLSASSFNENTLDMPATKNNYLSRSGIL